MSEKDYPGTSERYGPDGLKSGPFELTRTFLEYADQHGSVAIMYYYSHQFSEFRSDRPHIYFQNEKPFSRHYFPQTHANILCRANEFVIKNIYPIVLSEFYPKFFAAAPQLTDEITKEAEKFNVVDLFMVPVFGPSNINGVVSYGFESRIDATWKSKLLFLEGVAAVFHNQIVRYFANMREEIGLSDREKQVLRWMVKGKSTTDIATILEIQPSSVDTYTRRIFQKLGVHNRIAASISAVTQGLVKPG